MLHKLCRLSVAVVAAASWIVGLGCSGDQAPAPPAATGVASDEAHGHKPGAHGGIIVSLGGDSYHAEAVFEAGGTLRLFTLGSDETKVQEIDSQQLVAYVKAVAGAASTSVILRPEPQPGDSDGKTSQFVGRLPDELAGQALEVTIPSVRIAGDRFRLAFTSAAEAHEEAMPDKVADEEERQLYLTPGGLYTEADIEANGRATASERFAAFQARHDLHPRAGDKICPITLTKANPKCSWVIGGETYEFCCPPCVDEFVKLAKENPQAVKPPETYVK